MSRYAESIVVKIDKNNRASLEENWVEISFSEKQHIQLKNHNHAPATFCFKKNIFDSQDGVQQGDFAICFDVPEMNTKNVKLSSSAKNSEVEFTVSLTLPESEFLRNGTTSTTGKIKVND